MVKVSPVPKVLKFEEDEYQKICYGDHNDFEEVEKQKGDKSRWSMEVSVIVKHIETGIHYMGSYEEGLTENQDDSFYDCELTRCKQIEVKKLEWVED